MRKFVLIILMLSIILMTSCVKAPTNSQNITEQNNDINAWEKAFRDFLSSGINSDNGFMASEIWLSDLNFDNQPELAVLHDSGGSLGAFINFYSYIGNEVKHIITYNADARMYLDNESNRLFIYKEIIAFMGNERMLYGYLKEIISKDGIPTVNDILSVELNYDAEDFEEKAEKANTENEDAILSNEDLIIAKAYDNGTERQISGNEYIKIRNQYINPNKEYIDYAENANHVNLSQYDDLIMQSDYVEKILPTKDELDSLFKLWKDK